ncbi:hypothetical protein [Verrucosispora sp. NA02020]|uniref:hypothetical protein n=1 Tax=Verrucosispora sp. NA02020 TaxID=2742132 RepID=UPI003D72EB04
MKHLTAWIAATWATEPWLVVVAAGLAAALIAALLIAVFRLVATVVRAIRGAAPNFKLLLGQVVVQAGVTWAVVTGTWEFCTTVFKLPEHEATAFSVFLEAATWVTVGMIYEHGKSKDKDGNPNTGFGPAGPFFWLFSILGGVLAVLAGQTFGAVVGRAVVVVFGTCLWYLALLRVTRRSGAPSRFRWTPRALLVAVGALAPAEQDVRDEHEEWQVRRLARAMRWAGGRWPWSWLGARMLTARAEQTQEQVIDAARRRYAVAHVVVSSVRPDSDVMRRLIEEIQRGPAVLPTAAERQLMDDTRLSARMVASDLGRQVDELREIGGIRMPAGIAAQIPDEIPADWIARHSPAARELPATGTPEPARELPASPVPAGSGEVPATARAKRTSVAARVTGAVRRRAPRTVPVGTEAERTKAAYDTYLAEHGRAPSDRTLAALAGVGKTYAGTWKKQHAEHVKES